MFSNYFPSDEFKFYEVYNASEGFFGLQDEHTRDDMLLLVDNENFFEFIPYENYKKGNLDAIPLQAVEQGKDYVLVVSNASGLWRYVPGDTIRFTSLLPYRIQITGRTNQYINAFGEELMVGNVEMALQEVCEQTGAVIQEYSVAPHYISKDDKGRHDWVIEFIREPASMSSFRNGLDKCLQSLNSDYAAKRYKDLAMELLHIEKLPVGSFEKWYRARGKFGGQNKVPRLCNDRKFLEDLLGLRQKI